MKIMPRTLDRQIVHYPSQIHHRVGSIPLGLKRKGLKAAVPGGAGILGSHPVDRLIARGDSVIVIDNFFAGRKENVMHHFGNPRFELIRHDVVEPILSEADQIYQLACPASSVHYKFNSVKTIKELATLRLLAEDHQQQWVGFQSNSSQFIGITPLGSVRCRSVWTCRNSEHVGIGRAERCQRPKASSIIFFTTFKKEQEAPYVTTTVAN
ncbi:NAD(P)-binding domain [Dillenia turbinata]|uniref:UDP-glucuronate decarboxylase n=1 Tax=Dillenia turbinata TaxID=194707 RepID=A0AAN8VIR8_9MAGN